ncbi:hypothetical protein E1166_03790 [Micromonospora sp. KC213]|nr:hypothetical protein E1166_03790 [Micromonospora sp. KC213]
MLGSQPDLTVVGEAINGADAYGAGQARVVALDGVDLDFVAGRFTAIMGPGRLGLVLAVAALAASVLPARRALARPIVASLGAD